MDYNIALDIINEIKKTDQKIAQIQNLTGEFQAARSSLNITILLISNGLDKIKEVEKMNPPQKS
jgi:hypothetical protein